MCVCEETQTTHICYNCTIGCVKSMHSGPNSGHKASCIEGLWTATLKWLRSGAEQDVKCPLTDEAVSLNAILIPLHHL